MLPTVLAGTGAVILRTVLPSVLGVAARTASSVVGARRRRKPAIARPGPVSFEDIDEAVKKCDELAALIGAKWWFEGSGLESFEDWKKRQKNPEETEGESGESKVITGEQEV